MYKCRLLKRSVVLSICLVDMTVAFYWQLWSFSTMCTEDKGLTFARRNPWNCNSYLVCMYGTTLPGQCPPGLVYSDATQTCRDPVPSELAHCGRSVLASLETACIQRPGWKFRSPFSCAQFFECKSQRPSAGFLSSSGKSSSAPSTSGGTERQGQRENPLQLMECPYPSYYSTTTSSCESFDKVQCGTRPKPKAPCDYIQYRQLCDSPHCLPCSQRHPSCVGHSNGAHPLPRYDNLYILCYSERTFDVRKCNSGYIFSTTKKTCLKNADVKLRNGDIRPPPLLL
ncbi:hypothetical protein RRG08_006144 [Elysia crispata]|uniref:Chitin-binding type-2 domain-containing protein n=1 Tax=Elysia crispata TaxID=231223 RepID=A0AAE1ANG9_9GAST|nr:hypothetical protein RRG08_006144 [Elysia crispata]